MHSSMKFSRTPARASIGAERRRGARRARAALLVGSALGLPLGAWGEAPAISHGVASGDVGETSAVVWSRADRPARMTVTAKPAGASGDAGAVVATAEALAEADFTAQVVLEGLRPDTAYDYRVAFVSPAGRSEEAGAFRTAPPAEVPRRVSFLVAGDLGGQGYCRHAEHGYRIFRAAAELAPDFLVANGDMIYADAACPAQSPEGAPNVPGDFPAIHEAQVDWTNAAQLAEIYRAHWRYNRADPAFQALLRRTPMFVQWDDHEVVNDFGGPWAAHPAAPERPGYANLVATGRRVLFEWHPLRRNAQEPERIYRAARWGKHLALFLLDARSYRSPNTQPDAPEARKTLLGAAQLAWLKQELKRSTATWKVVSSDVPLSVPTGSRAELLGRDAFASGDADPFSASTGFERELLELVRFLDANDVRNVVFVATDVHFAAQIRYAGDYDGDGDAYSFHELISGPLSAVKVPPPRSLDATLHPVVLYAEGGLFNFAHVRIEEADGGVRLLTDVRDDAGRVRPGSSLRLQAE